MSSTPTSAGGYRLLVAEDDREIAALLQKYFAARGIDVVVAYDGDAAWQEFALRKVDIVMTDLMMPRRSGRELVVQIRGHITQSRTPIIITSASIQSAREEQELCAQLKVEGAFRKPLPLKDVLARMDELVLAFSGKRRPGAEAPPRPAPRTPAVPPPMPVEAARPPVASRIQTVPTTPGVAIGFDDVPATPAPDLAIAAPRAPVAPASARPTAGSLTMRMPAVGGPAAPVVTWWAEDFGAPPGLAGSASLPELADVLMRAFDERLTGVLQVMGVEGPRAICIHDGLVVDAVTSVQKDALGQQLQADGFMDAEGARKVNEEMKRGGKRFGEAAVRALGLPAFRVVQALERQTRRVLHRALQAQGRYALTPWLTSPVMATKARLDPVEAVQRACLEGWDPLAATSFLRMFERMHVLRGDAFNERVLVFAGLRPSSPVPAWLAAEMQVGEALARAQDAGQEAVLDMAALVLSRAVELGTPGQALKARRSAVAGVMGGTWESSDPAAMQVREAVAQEWLRSGGRNAYGLLKLRTGALPEDIEKALGELDDLLRPALDTTDLGPAKPYLLIMRARRDDVRRILLDPERRRTYEMFLLMRDQVLV